MRTIDPRSANPLDFNRYLTGAVAPRPIAFASTVDAAGQVNLSPFSFFNVFSYVPPILIFSVSRRMRDNTSKDTLENVREVPEVVINMVNFDMVEQMSLASTEYDRGVNEFEKAGFTPAPSQRVRPPRVAESPVSFECRVNQVVALGAGGGAGNLVICEVVLAHFAELLFDEDDAIDPARLDAVARLGGNWYCRAGRESLFEIPKPGRNLGIGVDQLPEPIRQSSVLTGNHLGRLGILPALPGPEVLEPLQREEIIQKLRAGKAPREQWHQVAREVLEAGDTARAMGILLLGLEAEH